MPARRYIIGQETCAACGYVMVVVAGLHNTQRSHLTTRAECPQCGLDASLVSVWFPGAIWPEVVALVAFDEERERLRLPRLTEASWQ